jgi:hypothetical protein
MTTIRSEGQSGAVISYDDLEQPSVEELARRRLVEEGLYAFCFNQVKFRYSQGTLTLTGRVPSFYMKQVLQTHLRELDGVARIDNRVDVVSSTGLSSVRPR